MSEIWFLDELWLYDQWMADAVVTHLQVHGDGEENQRGWHPHVASEQQDLFPHVLNNHELQDKKTVSPVNHMGKL